ncbi:MAG TPA: alpha/beta fold hydrolase [Solirubrobacteraceae bacterium]|nr:alpha/beta fold hydrolase [Solirubrobacteraceae bacterium]
MTPERGIRFFPWAGRRVAYAVNGDGPPLVVAAWWVSHIEHDWQHPGFRSFFEALGKGYGLVRYDRPGVGLSGRDDSPESLTIDTEVELLGRMLDELGCERATLFGGSSGGCAAIAFAARFPERVEQLMLYGAYADGSAIAPPDVRTAVIGAVRSHWGLGSRLLADVFLGEEGGAERRRFVQAQQESCDAETAAALLEHVYDTDVREQLESVRAPTVIVHRRADRAIPYELGRQLAAGIRGASLVSLDGSAHFPWLGDGLGVVHALRTGLGSTDVQDTHVDEMAPPAVLSPREKEVLSLVAEGMTERDIAARLVVSPHTVHRHMANIRAKLSRGSAAAAVAEAARLGLI